MTFQVEDITERIKREIKAFEPPVEVANVGYVLEVGDGIARLSGL
jgi:F0F1-type ATP synthase alpha subunit